MKKSFKNVTSLSYQIPTTVRQCLQLCSLWGKNPSVIFSEASSSNQEYSINFSVSTAGQKQIKLTLKLLKGQVGISSGIKI